MGTFSRLVLVLLALLSFSLTPPPAPAAEWRDVTHDRPANARSGPAHRLMYSPTDNGSRHRPPDPNNTRNNKKLVPQWIFSGSGPWEPKIAYYAGGSLVSQARRGRKSKVFGGCAGPGEWGPRGLVEAFVAETGKSLGRWYSGPPAGEPGSEPWQADTWKIGGGA